MMRREKEKRVAHVPADKDSSVPDSSSTNDPGGKTSPVSEGPSPNAAIDKKIADKNVEFSKPKSTESEYSAMYQQLEFLPFNLLPTDMDELIFPERLRPLAIFDDPYWPNKASCIKLVETLKGAPAALSTFTGTYLSPEAKGVA